MIIRIPEKRRDGRSSFLQLVAYTVVRDEEKPDTPLEPEHPGWRRPRSKGDIFNHLVDYISRHGDSSLQEIMHADPAGHTQVMFDGVMCETNCFNIATASVEMNAVALQNTRCKDPVMHYFLSWPETDSPTTEQIFESVRYTLSALGMADHQYVAAIHTDTNNIHCHVAANRIHPVTYKTADDSFTRIRLQHTARELELKYQWTHTNGFFVVDEQGDIVRARRDVNPAPQGAKGLEYYADVESLHSYAVVECAQQIDEAMANPAMDWRDVHKIFVTAGLELKEKGKGLAVYSIDNPELPPVKASSVHPDLTLSCLEKDLGPFQPMHNAGNYTKDEFTQDPHALVHMYCYMPTMHARDLTARLERRLSRAEAREDLKARYAAYKSAWVKPKQDGAPAKLRYQNLSKQFAWQKARARITMSDPLMRKLTYHIIEVERMKAMASLRLTLKAERDAFRADPANHRMPYRVWVEQQALQHDQAAIAQLRGWSYRMKRKDRTAVLSENGIQCATADDTPAFALDGYRTAVMKDGTVQYAKDGVVQLQDKGNRIEVRDYRLNQGETIPAAMALAEHKSGEHLVFDGEPAFVREACGMVTWFNEGGDKPLPLTDPQQRRMAGYGQVTPAASVAPATRPPEPTQDAERKPDIKPGNTTFRPR